MPRYLDKTKLKAARLKAGLDQATAAAKAGTTRSQLSHHEAGTTGCHMPQLVRYAFAYDCKPVDLMLDSALTPAGTPAATAA